MGESYERTKGAFHEISHGDCTNESGEACIFSLLLRGAIVEDLGWVERGHCIC